MGPLHRAVAAALIPLLGIGCGAPRREVRLVTSGGRTVIHVPESGGQPIEVPEAELWGSFRQAARELVVPVDPLAATEEAFGLSEASGTYWYLPRSGRLLEGPLGGGLEEVEGPARALTRGYLGWCGGTRLGGGDCLHLLKHGEVLPLHGRYAVTLVMAMRDSFDSMLDSLKDFADPHAVAVMLATAAAVYLVLLLIPEPISKFISVGITAGLVGYLGWDLFWSLVHGWKALAPAVETATDFSQLRAAADDFGKVLGPRMGQLLILLVSHSLGKGLAAKGKALPPRFAEANAQAERLTGVRWGAAATAVRSVNLGAGVITISLASSAMVVAGAPPAAGGGPSPVARELPTEEEATAELAGKLRFTETAARHMEEVGRHVPRHTLAEAIRHGARMLDPQGAPGAIEIVQEIIVNGTPRTLEIIYREADHMILHFLYK